VDPSRNRVVARHDPLYTGVDVSGTFLLKAYRWWGYAPELLALGVSGYSTFADFYVKRDRREGHEIALRDLVRSIDFKRQPFPASFNHAASFVKWLIHRYGVDRFRELYGKSTDLSFERALFSVYNQTLEEMERDWLAYLNSRTFTATEYYAYAKRAAAYHHYTDHYDLLQLTVASRETVPAAMFRQITLAAAQLGKWPEAVDYAYQAAEETPSDPQALSLLGEVQWAVGDLDGVRYHLNQVIHLDSSDARPYVTLGDVELAERRLDAAAGLWQEGLAKTVDRDPTAVELLLRLGRTMRTHRNRDSAQVLFGQALTLARGLIPKQPGDIRPITRMGETLMELDSLDQALAYLLTAAYVADAPQEMGRIYIDIGRCHDLAGRRKLAVEAYETVFQFPATYNHERLARRYVNSIYTH
jgi:tetratricopeptide (TPR) repeat protein